MDAKTMLDLGKENGLKTMRECYESVMSEYKKFFSDENYLNEETAFENDIDKYGLELMDTIEEAFAKIGIDDCWNEIEDSQNDKLLGC